MGLQNNTLISKFYEQEIQSQLQAYGIHKYAQKHMAKLKCPMKELKIDPMLKSNSHSQKGFFGGTSHLLFYSPKISPFWGVIFLFCASMGDICWHIQKQIIVQHTENTGLG